MINCSDGSTISEVFDDLVNWRTLLGSIVIIVHGSQGITLRFVSTEPDKLHIYWIVREIGTGAVAAELPFHEKAEAERCLVDLQPKYQGKLRLELAELPRSRGSTLWNMFEPR